MAAAKSVSLFFASLFFVCMLGVMMRAQEQAKDSSKSTVLGSGHGIDHVAIAVKDLETANKTYRDVLGFAVFAGGKHPVGTRNSGPNLENCYLELITVWDRTKAQGGMVGTFLEKHEGALYLGLRCLSSGRHSEILAHSWLQHQGTRRRLAKQRSRATRPAYAVMASPRT